MSAPGSKLTSLLLISGLFFFKSLTFLFFLTLIHTQQHMHLGLLYTDKGLHVLLAEKTRNKVQRWLLFLARNQPLG